MTAKHLFRAIGFGGALVILASIILIAGKGIKSEKVSKELDDNQMRRSVMGQVFNGVFEALRQFKNENRYLPPESNQSITAALSGNNKSGKNYIHGWTDVLNGQILDIDNKPLVFHFINDNEMTVYTPATGQLYHGFLSSDQATVTQESGGD